MSVKHKMIRGTLILTSAGLPQPFHGILFSAFFSAMPSEKKASVSISLSSPSIPCVFLSELPEYRQRSPGLWPEKYLWAGRKMPEMSLYAGLAVTVSVSLAEVIFIQQNAGMIAQRFLGDIRCTELLLIISYALPCASVHSCICGYSYGLQQTKTPAVSQLVEQTARISSVLILFFLLRESGRTPSVSLAVAGIVIGEFASALYSARMFSGTGGNRGYFSADLFGKSFRELIPLSLPLTANRAVGHSSAEH